LMAVTDCGTSRNGVGVFVAELEREVEYPEALPTTLMGLSV
jgi:hypothetical protein